VLVLFGLLLATIVGSSVDLAGTENTRGVKNYLFICNDGVSICLHTQSFIQDNS